MTDPKDKFYPGFNDENLDRDKKMKEEFNEDINKDDLAFDAEKDTYSLDVNSVEGDYVHPDPYDTSAPNGSDFDSTWDEANPVVGKEYDPNASLETDLDDLGMHVDSGKIVELDPIDEELSKTEEDERDDLDEEGYPKNDRP